MFYSNNNGYMEDLYYYNQMPNNTYMNNPGNNMMGNNMLGNSMNQNLGTPMMTNNMGVMNSNGMFMGQINSNQQNMMPMQNLSSLYPSIYRIINPVVSRVVSNGNNQIVNEDSLNNMVDTVFNIVEGQIDLEGESTTQRNVQSENQTNLNSSSNMTSGSNSSSRTTETNRHTTQTMQATSNRNNRNDSLLRDLIRILIIKELLARNQFQRQYVQTQGMPMGFNSFF